MTLADTITAQIGDAIDNLTDLLGDFAGLTWGDATVTGFASIPRECANRLIAGQLDRNTARAITRALGIFHDYNSELPPPLFWRGEFGQLLFAARPFLDHSGVDFQTAAAILDVSRQRVSQFATAKRLAVTPDHKIQCASLYAMWDARRAEEAAA